MQALVIAHACYGHNSFFKNNYLFKTWTIADSIVDYLVFAKNYIRECEERFGVSEVEETLDACHALMTQGVDRYQRPNPISLGEEQIRQEKRADYLQTLVNDLWRTIPKVKNNESIDTTTRFPTEPQENVLYFLEKNAPLLASWQREIIRIVRKMAQYFYPQRQTKVMNEGWATFWHYQIIYQLYTEQLLTEQFMLEFLHTHTNVIYQPKYDSSYYSGLNPYTLGFNMFMDLKRICEAPTAEDKHWFPDIANSNWITTLDFAMRNFKDDSFIAQFLSPKLIRDMKLFSILDDEQKNHLQITSIHNEDGYQIIRQQLAENYNIGKIDPDIQIFDINHRGDRTLTLRYTQHNARPLALKSATQVMKHLYKLWGFPIKLETVNISGKLLHTEHCPATPKISNS
jgi:spore cortex formation protein SpoVR/YcgB (stage V sporulation)